MRHRLPPPSLLAAAAGFLLSCSLAHAQTAASPPRLRSVLLSSGVAQLGWEAELDGSTAAATLPLDLPLDQVSDVLKSLRVDDPAGGGGTGALPQLRLPGRQPLADAFRALPFPPEALASADALFAALVGAEVRVPAAGIAGRVVAVSPFEMRIAGPGNAEGATLTRHRLSIATETGVETTVLEDVPGVEIASPVLRAQLAQALAAVAATRAQERRRAELVLSGGSGGSSGARRQVSFGYVIAAPVWKTAWRLTLMPDGSQARLQGYAVVENGTGQDWDGITLSLATGEPVLFAQPLYDPVYADRPQAPVEVGSRPVPQVDRPAFAMAPPPPPAPAPAQAATIDGLLQSPRLARQGRGAPGAAGGGSAAPQEQEAEPPASAEQAATQATFRLAQPVSLSAGQTALLPFLDQAVPGRRVLLVQPGTLATHPLAAVQLVNATGSALPPGIVTLYETTAAGSPGGGNAVTSPGNGLVGSPIFVGDARLPGLPAGASRLAAFAVDAAVALAVEQGSDRAALTARAAGGVLEVITRERATTLYKLSGGKPGQPVLVEQPKRTGWSLAEPRESAEETNSAWRITQPLGADGALQMRVVLERPRSERIVLLDQAPSRLLALADAGALSDAQRAALRRAAELRSAVERAQAEQRQVREAAEAVVSDQARVRENLKAVPGGSDLHRDYLARLRTQEAELASLRARSAMADAEASRAATVLREYLEGLRL